MFDARAEAAWSDEGWTAPVGGNATFAVTATGDATLTYQWAKDDTDIAGATEATLSLTAVQVADAGNYSVTVTNSVGSVTSNAVALVLSGLPPTILTPPAASTVTAKGSEPLSYPWRKGGVAVANGGTVSGVTTASLVIANAQLADAGSYDVVVSNGQNPDDHDPARGADSGSGRERDLHGGRQRQPDANVSVV